MRFSVSFLHHLIDPLLLLLLLLLCSSSVFIVESSCNDFESSRTSEMAAVRLGGIKDSHVSAENSAEVETLARFAVDEHNKKQNAILEFARVVRAREQVVAGKLHHLTLEAIDGGKKKLYEAKVWVKPWLNFTELQEFKDAGDSPSITPSDLGAKRDGHESGWQVVPVNDPEVLNAAHHAVKTIQQRSNSLFPYQLQEVSHAKAEVVDDTAKFNLDLKVMRGNKEERFNVEVHKNSEGNLLLSQMDEHKPAAT